MIASRWVPVATALAIGYAFAGQRILPAIKVSTFAAMPKGDQITLDYSSVGCFSSKHYLLTFTRGKNFEVNVTKIDRVWDGGRSPKEVRKNLGALTLSPHDVEGLDHLVAFYRSGPKGGCTTVDHVELMQKRNGKMIGQESFTDASCSMSLDNLTNVGELIQRLPQDQPRH